MKTAVLSVFFPEILPYLKEFLSSLSNQSSTDFDVIIFNDGLPSLEEYLRPFKNLNISVIEEKGLSPIEIRYSLLDFCKTQKYDVCMFGDADDYFSENKVEVVCKLINDYNYDVVIHDLNIIDANNKPLDNYYLSNRLENNQLINQDAIVHFNFMGLGNTVFRVDSIPAFPYVTNIVAFDWYLFTIMLESGAKCLFNNAVQTFYRMHGNNIIGINTITPDKIKTIINVKRLHYSALRFLGSKYANLADQFDENNVFVDPDIHCPLWWEQVKIKK